MNARRFMAGPGHVFEIRPWIQVGMRIDTTLAAELEHPIAQAAQNFRLNFLRNLKPEHPLYPSTEARAARGEAGE